MKRVIFIVAILAVVTGFVFGIMKFSAQPAAPAPEPTPEVVVIEVEPSAAMPEETPAN